MKKLFLNPRFLSLLLLAVTILCLSGCATSNVDQTNRTERPWNSPTDWEQAGPMSGVLDQH